MSCGVLSIGVLGVNVSEAWVQGQRANRGSREESGHSDSRGGGKISMCGVSVLLMAVCPGGQSNQMALSWSAMGKMTRSVSLGARSEICLLLAHFQNCQEEDIEVMR